ncbi:tetratricopeptide repeat protein [Tundrisphaera sp. TA3]|uniref:tetratricopeptide repeat protein n=1 Tax=Tundrisphaera sp. TA3 TaxID=3435775 RepID=UPI003EB910FB
MPKGRPRKLDDEPTIRSAPAEKAAPKAGPARGVDPTQFWKGYFEKSDEAPSQFFVTVAQLVQAKDFVNAEAAIKAYLNAHKKQAEPWMYEWLVKILEIRKRPDSEVKQALEYAAYLAKRNRNVNDLIRVADMMVLRKIDGSIGEGATQTSTGELIDLAAEIAPTNAFPPMMSINLALRTKDPKRMMASTDQLLSLGWPGSDDQLRRDARKQVEALAKILRDEGQTDEADAMLARWPEIEARDLYLRLTWEGEADIDLTVAEPLGATASFNNPRTVFGGAIVKNGYGKHPEEVYVCPRAFAGDYTAKVDVIFNDPAKPVTEVTLEVIKHEGTPAEARETHRLKLSDLKPIVIHLEEGRRKVVLPYIPPPERPVIDPKTKPNGAEAKAAPNPATTPAPARPASPPIRP